MKLAQRIIALTSENVKRIQLVEIRPNPDGSLVVIGGPNEAGKSSLLDSIEMAIGGKDAIPDRPIREGAAKARIVLETDDLIVERTFTAKGTQLTVKNRADGTKLNSPQELLDGLTNKVAFDPLGFLRMKADEQAKTLRRLVGIDFTALDKEHKEKYDERTVKNREVKAAEGRLNAITRHPGVPKEPVSAEDILNKLQDASRANEANAKKRDGLCDLNDDIDKSTSNIERLKKELEAAQAGHAILIQQRDTLFAEVRELQDIDMAAIQQELATIEQTNEKVRANIAWQQANDELVKLNKQSQALTERLSAIDREKADTLAKAEFPIQGLSFDAEGITFDGIPFAQVNTAKQLRVSVAIAFAMQPALKVAIVRNGGNDLDKKNLALLAEYVAEQGGQCWLEKCTDGPECSVIIEDGTVKEDRTQKA